MYEIRNLVWRPDLIGIDLEWNHPTGLDDYPEFLPKHGWIPFFATPTDPVYYGREIFDQAYRELFGRGYEDES